MEKPKQVSEEEVKRRTRRSFLVGLGGFLTGVVGVRWVFSRGEESGISWPLRKMLKFNEKVLGHWRGLTARLVPEVARVTGSEPRVNGDLGLENPDADLSKWKLRIRNTERGKPDLLLGIEEIRKLPSMETSFNFKCIEGWSEDMTCTGVRFSDFLSAYDLGRRDPLNYFDYVALETPDRKYYVSIDMQSMLHPQTLLCYEMNGAPISYDNGAPLRLIIPIKYGIKHLKQIGTMSFADTRPPDYWAEQGYDWYSGL